MAGYSCDSEDGNQAIVVITNLGDGMVTAWCGNCFYPWLAAMEISLRPPGEPEPEASPELLPSGFDGPAALDVYPAGDPRNDEPLASGVTAASSSTVVRKRAPRKASAKAS